LLLFLPALLLLRGWRRIEIGNGIKFDTMESLRDGGDGVEDKLM
jgi:hypothetical protein